MNGTWKADEILLTDADIQNINSQAGKLKWHEDKSQNFRGNWTQMVSVSYTHLTLPTN